MRRLALVLGLLLASVTAHAQTAISTLTLINSTTAYTAGQLIASSATAASIVNPIVQAVGVISRVRLSTNDATATAWGGQTIQVDLWTVSPTWTNGDRGTWLPATGTAGHLGAFTCVMAGVAGSSEYGDGTYAECAPAVGNFISPNLSSSTNLYWSLDAVTGSGTTGASKVFTLSIEFVP